MEFDQLITFLPVTDLAVSDGFYRSALGLSLVVDQGDCRIYRVSDTAYLGVCQRPSAEPAPGLMITLVTPEVDAWHRRLVAAGALCDRPPGLNERYGIYQALYRDPDGHVIEIQRFEMAFPPS